MLVEVFGSIGFGVIAGSFALLAFGGDSLIELISGVAVLTGLRKDSSLSNTSEGHSKITEQFTSLLLFALIPVIGLGALFSYVAGLKPEASPLGITIAIGAVIVMPYLYIQKKKNRQRDPVASTLDRRYRVGNMSLHGPCSSRRTARGIFPRTLVG